MRRRRTFLIVFVILIVVLLAGVSALVLRGGDFGLGPAPTAAPIQETATPTPKPEKAIVVALQPVRRGMRIPPDAVQVRRWPIDELPSDPIDNLDDVIGMFAASDLVPRQPIRASQIKTVFLEGADIDLAIPEGHVAYALPVRIYSAVANALHPGSRVDVLISFSVVDVDPNSQVKQPEDMLCPPDLLECVPMGDQVPALVSQYTVQNALVLGTGIWGVEPEPGVEVLGPGEEVAEEEPEIPVVEGDEAAEEAPPPEEPRVPLLTEVTVVTLAVNPQDALVLKWAWESDSSVDLVLRSAIDADNFPQPEAVTLKYMIERFQISLPPKLPHVAENDFEYSLLENAPVVPQE
jgi:Flp pilus assembly protein CpaB